MANSLQSVLTFGHVASVSVSAGTCPPAVAVLLDLYSESRNLDLQQRYVLGSASKVVKHKFGLGPSGSSMSIG